jgi:hypothetical protein
MRYKHKRLRHGGAEFFISYACGAANNQSFFSVPPRLSGSNAFLMLKLDINNN